MEDVFEFDGGLVRFTLAGRVLAQMLTWLYWAGVILFLLAVAFIVGAAMALLIINKVVL